MNVNDLLQDILSRLPNVKAQRRNGNYIARCPAHDSKGGASLSVASVDGKILLHCFAGCTVE
ncbi:MAG: hypothetical protein LUQ65_09535 [Candidatus Helarchaeota archaeon]|nr:hypothetical protein [Candidatus Helarchaeota archaeon]